jgi:hypothetical protein
MDRATQVANILRRGAGQPGAVWPSFGRNSAPARWSARIVLIAVGCLGVLLLVGSLFWIVLKVALVLAVVVMLARRFGTRALAFSGSDALRAVARTPFHVIAAGALLVAAFAFGGTTGFLVAAGVCIGVYVRARLIDWP